MMRIRQPKQASLLAALSLAACCFGCGGPSEISAYRLAVSIRDGNTADIFIANGNGRLIDRITDTPSRTEMWPTWSASGDALFFEATDNDSVKTLVVRRDLGTATEDTIHMRAGRGGLWFSVSPDGEKLAYVMRHGHETQLVVQSTRDSTQLVVGRKHGRLIRAEWNPNSRYILCQVKDKLENQWDLALVDAKTGIVERLTNTPDLSEFRPNWSPDGRFLAYSTTLGDQEIRNGLKISNADGSGAKALVVENQSRMASGVWSRDLRLAALGERPLPMAVLIWPKPWVSSQLYRTKLDEKWRRGRVVWSPDGKYLAVNVTARRRGKAGGWNILIVDAGGRVVKEWRDDLDASCPAWAPLQTDDARTGRTHETGQQASLP
jgi:Tol biopolymer transport system component